ncbi:MAG: AAA family ATPase [Cyanobacteria bacterium J06649_4]
MLSKIEAFHYRCFEQLNIDLSRYHILVGANGSGKSTLLDIPILLRDLLKHGLIAAFLECPAAAGDPRANSLQELVHQGRGNYFWFAIEAELPKNIVSELIDVATKAVQSNEKRHPQKIRYELKLEIFNKRELQIAEENLWLMSRKAAADNDEWGIGGVRSTNYWTRLIEREGGRLATFREKLSGKKPVKYSLEPNELALASVPRDHTKYSVALWLRDFLEKESIQYEPDWTKLRVASPPGRLKKLRADAANLPWLLLNLKRNEPDTFADWEEHVKCALPNIQTIGVVEREDDHHAYLRIKYSGDYEVTSSGLSYGTLHILALTVLPYLLSPPSLICIEELENGIHPKAIETILESLRSVYSSQIMVSSHSMTALAHTKLSQIIVLRADSEGVSEAVSGDKHPLLAEWQGELDIPMLFAAGVLE